MSWETLAEQAEALASYEESHGRFGGAYRNKAESYRRAAAAAKLEEQFGVWHCVCCLKPMGTKQP